MSNDLRSSDAPQSFYLTPLQLIKANSSSYHGLRRSNRHRAACSGSRSETSSEDVLTNCKQFASSRLLVTFPGFSLGLLSL